MAHKLHKDIDNPFRPAPGSDPPLLVGRESELAAMDYAMRLTESGGAAQPIIATGLRGMGKTALLRRALRSLPKAAIVISGEASATTSLAVGFRRSIEEASKRFESIPKKLGDAFDKILLRLPKASFELPHDLGAVSLEGRDSASTPKNFAETLWDLYDAASSHERVLIFAIDEIQTGTASDLEPIIELIHQTSGEKSPALLLGAGLPSSKDHLFAIKTYTERWKYLRLEFLTREEVRLGLESPVNDRGVAYEPAALRLLVKAVSGYPFFIQEFGSMGWLSKIGTTITKEGVSRMLPGVFRLLDDSLYDSLFRSLTLPELAYALALAALGAGAHRVADVAASVSETTASASWLRNQLLKKDVAYSPAKGMIEFRLPLTEGYLERHRKTLSARLATPKKNGE